LIIKYNAIHLNSHFDETGDFISLFTYKVQKFLNKNKDKVFLIDGMLADIIMEDTTYNIHLNGMFLFRDFRLIANLKENQFNLIHNKIKLNSYTNYAVIVKIRNIKTTLYSINAEGDSELIYDTPGLLIVYSDLLEIKQLH